MAGEIISAGGIQAKAAAIDDIKADSITTKSFNTETTPDVQMVGVMADVKQPFLKTRRRWDYMLTYVDTWKDFVSARFYAVILFAMGVLLLFSIPVIALGCLAGSMFYWQIKEGHYERLDSGRLVMYGQ
jgi:hypothetical protein